MIEFREEKAQGRVQFFATGQAVNECLGTVPERFADAYRAMLRAEPVAASASVATVEMPSNEVAEVLEWCRGLLRDIARRHPIILKDCDVEAFVLNEINPALVAARKLAGPAVAQEPVAWRVWGKTRGDLNVCITALQVIGGGYAPYQDIPEEIKGVCKEASERLAEYRAAPQPQSASMEAMATDAARLDWLEKEANSDPLLLHSLGPGEVGGGRSYRGLGLKVIGRTLRKAIDDAMGAASPPMNTLRPEGNDGD